MSLLNQKLPPTQKTKVSEMVAHIIIPELWEQRQEDSCLATLCSPLGKLHDCERPCLNTKVDGAWQITPTANSMASQLHIGTQSDLIDIHLKCASRYQEYFFVLFLSFTDNAH